MTKKRIVIIGGGFAGIAALQELRHVKDAEVVLIDEKTSQIFQPLLFQAATCNICSGDLESPIREHMKGAEHMRFVHARAERVDAEAKVVYLTTGETIAFDYLLMAAGSITNCYGMQDVETHALKMKDQKEAIAIRAKLLSILDKRANLPHAERQKPLNLVVVGAGPTGVELMGALVEFVRDRWDQYYPSLKGDTPKFYLMEAAPCILGPLPKEQQDCAQRWLEQMGVQVMTQAKIEGYDGKTVRIAGAEPIDTEFFVWCAGVACDTIVTSLGFEQERGGRIVVDRALRVKGRDDIYVAGDAMSFLPEGAERPLPTTAAVAEQAGRHAGRNLAAVIAGREPAPFVYQDRGFIAVVAKGQAVGRVFSMKMAGRMCWTVWAALHIFLPYSPHTRWSLFWKFLWNVVRGSSPYRNG